MFKVLGWDIDNTKDYAEAYKDVVHEDALKVGPATKAPDYCFRIGGVRKFFLEAKKPAVNIKQDVHPAFQLRRYAWSAKLPLSILTNFEGFAVYDCRIKPLKTDKASKDRVLYLTYEDYEENWEDIAGIFSREAILKGSFDKYVEKHRGKRGTAEVDKAFLEEIERWRADLARNIALRNKELTQRELNFAVQKTIDRLIFLRICEDRNIEPYESLRGLQNGDQVYKRLFELFRKADNRYDSGLFHFRPEKGRSEDYDQLTSGLTVDDKPLKDIIKNLYYPDSPYEFSVLPADILGQVYEQFLGKVIRLTPGHHAVVEEKPEVRKAGGVYYTPTYIVDYIVKHTVGELVKDKKPGAKGGVSKLRILDPACGSGSFLLGAYQFLLDWHLEQYQKDPERWAKGGKPAIYQRSNGDWALTVEERKRILLNNIYGVDIDPQAAEVTKLSLLLKVLEGENKNTITAMFGEKVLPDLSGNIKCGNSLIGPDFYQGRQMDLLNEDEIYRINAFDWEEEFKDIIKNVGFDTVIGNPPYRRELDYKDLMAEIANSSLGRKFRAPRMDLWYYFVHLGLNLLRKDGILSFITNAYWVSGTGATNLIATLRDECHIEEIFFFGKLKVFEQVSGQHMVFRLRKGGPQKATTICRVEPKDETNAKPFVEGKASAIRFQQEHGLLFRGGKIDIEPPQIGLLGKFEAHPPLERFGVIRQGIAENPQNINKKTNKKFGNQWKTGEGVFALQWHELNNLSLPEKEFDIIRPYYDLCDLGRYMLAENPSLALIYSTMKTCPDIERYPTIRNHLAKFRPVMEARRETIKGSNRWWHLHWPRDESLWKSAKLICLQMSKRPSFVPSHKPVYVSFSVNVFVPSADTPEDLRYFAGLLNSKLLWVWFAHNAKRRGVGLEINGNILRITPIRRIDFTSSAAKQQHDQMVSLVQSMLDNYQKHTKAKEPQQRKTLERQIAATDKQIDQLVYELYGLTDEDIKIVEEATAS